MIVDYIDAHKTDYGVEPICRVLAQAGVQIAPSTYYAAKTRPPSARAIRDAELVEQIHQIHGENYAVYGARKVYAELKRQGIRVARCTVERLMCAEGLRGITRSKNPRTTIASVDTERPADLVNRGFITSAPDQLWVADITYVRTFAGWTYAAFVIDVFSRRIVGWQLSTSLRTDLALDALEMGIWTREHAGQNLSQLIHHSDRGVQYRAVRYTNALPMPARSPRSAAAAIAC